MPAVGDVTDMWDKLLGEYEQVVYIPLSSGLSSSCSTAAMIADDEYEGRVFVADIQRVSVTQKQAAKEALALAQAGFGGQRIKEILEENARESSIYITVETLKYLKRGGRITPAAAALGTLLRIKPVLQIQGAEARCICQVPDHAPGPRPDARSSSQGSARPLPGGGTPRTMPDRWRIYLFGGRCRRMENRDRSGFSRPHSNDGSPAAGHRLPHRPRRPGRHHFAQARSVEI